MAEERERSVTDEKTQSNEAPPRLVVAVFVGPYGAASALNALHEAGCGPDQVSVVAKNTDTRREIVEQTEMGEPQDQGADTMMGALAGTTLGGVLGLGALFIPGVGPVLVAGALATTVGGAALGAVVGHQAGKAEERGIAGAGLAVTLGTQGVPPDDAAHYEGRVRDNAILLAVRAADDETAHAAQQILLANEGQEAHIYGITLRHEAI